MADGHSFKQFQAGLEGTLQAKGWWGQAPADPKTGEIPTYPSGNRVQLGSPARLKLIYKQNIQSAYAAGRRQRQLATIDSHPYWQWQAVGDARTRYAHAKLNGTIRRADDPWWDVFYPPNGYGCRCEVRALPEHAVKESDVLPAARGAEETQITLPGSEKPILLRAMRMADGSLHPGTPGFDIAPGMTDVGLYERLFAAAHRTQPLGTARNILAGALQSKEAQQVWELFVRNAYASSSTPGFGMALGLLDGAMLASLGLTPQSLVVFIQDRLIAGPKGRRHQNKTADLPSAEELISLRQQFGTPESAYWSDADKKLLLFYPADSKQKTKLVVEFNQAIDPVKGLRLVSNRVASIYKIKNEDFIGLVKPFQKVR